MLPLLIAFGIFYAIGWFFTANPWHTVLKIWLYGWLVFGILNFVWAVVSEALSRKNSDKTNISPSTAFKTAIVVALVQSLFMVYWPSFVYGRLEEAWTNLAIRMGWRQKPTERSFVGKDNAKAVKETENTWQLEGESDLSAITIPNPPTPLSPTTVRLTHSNSYGPFDEIDFYIRIGNPDTPTDQFDLKSANDWVRTRLIEELVCVDNQEMFRSEAEEPFEEETPWEGTYEAELQIPSGRHSIEIKIVSRQPKIMASRVLSDWEIVVP